MLPSVSACLLILTLICAAHAAAADQAAPKLVIVTTIKPLAIIAKSAVGDSASVDYLQSAAQSEHDVTLPLSAHRKIKQADLVVWIGDSFEPRIAQTMTRLPAQQRITVLQLPAIAAAETEPHTASGTHGDLHVDPHVWLNPDNANIIASVIQQRLGLPLHDVLTAAQRADLSEQLAPLQHRDYLSHHDAYGHFAQAFNLRAGLSIRDIRGASQGAKSLYLLRQRAATLGVSCVFSEPQYAGKDAEVLAEELNVPLVTLDPQGFSQALTHDAYSEFMQGFVTQFKACF
ncbi:MAG: zinc ABC transporter substrate-binding protein [Porticoccaceae bacterium]|nr:zinc ABC transporter substrate-binding protein [Porticoccaceae bacterium]